MRLGSWKPAARGRLRGFATVELPIGLKLTDCAVFVGANGAWVSLPVKPQLYRQGRQRKGADSKPSYVPILEWRSRDLAERWSKSVFDLVRQRRPAALGDDVS